MNREKVTLSFSVEVYDCPKDEAPFIIDGIRDAIAGVGFEADVWRRREPDEAARDGGSSHG